MQRLLHTKEAVKDWLWQDSIRLSLIILSFILFRLKLKIGKSRFSVSILSVSDLV